jgi:hypothetical protein
LCTKPTRLSQYHCLVLAEETCSGRVDERFLR